MGRWLKAIISQLLLELSFFGVRIGAFVYFERSQLHPDCLSEIHSSSFSVLWNLSLDAYGKSITLQHYSCKLFVLISINIAVSNNLIGMCSKQCCCYSMHKASCVYRISAALNVIQQTNYFLFLIHKHSFCEKCKVRRSPSSQLCAVPKF